MAKKPNPFAGKQAAPFGKADPKAKGKGKGNPFAAAKKGAPSAVPFPPKKGK